MTSKWRQHLPGVIDPTDLRKQLYPATLTSELVAKSQEEVIEGELFKMQTPIHLKDEDRFGVQIGLFSTF